MKKTKPVLYLVYDKDLGEEWIFKILHRTKKINWNPSVQLPDRAKELYLKLYYQKIIEAAEII